MEKEARYDPTFTSAVDVRPFLIEPEEIASEFSSHWYAIQTRTKQEGRAAMNLASFGFFTFLPMIRRPRRTSIASGAAPLFPRYLFVRCDIARSVRQIRYTRGVANVLGTGEGPTSIDDAIIESIQSRIGKDGFVQVTDALEAGDPVEITSGPLKGLVGVFCSATSAAQRVVLLLNTVHSQLRVVVDTQVVHKRSA